MVLEAPQVISTVRFMIGSTNSSEAQPGTIRGDLSMSQRFNLVHGSDSQSSAQRGIDLFFLPIGFGGLMINLSPDNAWP